MSEPVSTYCLSIPSYLEMSSDSIDEGEVPHYAYLVLRIFPLFPTKIAVLCHHAETNDIVLSGGRVSLFKNSKIFLGHCNNFWGSCGIFHWSLIVL